LVLLAESGVWLLRMDEPFITKLRVQMTKTVHRETIPDAQQTENPDEKTNIQ
jgi:hypothetical protein